MKVTFGKIIEATEDELFSVWLKCGWCEIMSFYEYKYRCEYLGTTILDSEEAPSTDELTRNYWKNTKYATSYYTK